MNPKVRKAVAGITIGAASVAAWVVGGRFVGEVQFARAEQQVEASRQQLASVQDLASVYKAVGKAVEPSVVSIQVSKTVKTPRISGRLPNDDLLRRFFPDNDGDGEPDVPRQFRFQTPDDNGGSGDEYEMQGTGSGVIMEVSGSTGWIVTNNHVAGDAGEMVITLSDGRTIKNAKLVGADPKSDIAVVKIEADHLIPAKWGDSDKLEMGDVVLAFGSPFGYVGSMTHGIVSALNRQARIIEGQFAYENFIQTDASINPGNSGGALVDLQGEVIGINTAIATRSGGFQGIGFAVPSNQARYVYNAIKDTGKVVRGWLGVEIADVAKLPDEAAALGYTGNKGVIVKSTMKDTPATGKLKAGDIVTAIDGKSVASVQELRSQIARTTPGTDVKLSVHRDGKDQDVTVKLGEQPESVGAIASAGNSDRQSEQSRRTVDQLGLQLATPTDELANRFGFDSGAKGAVITEIKPNSLGFRAGLQRGDVITKVDSTDVSSAQDVTDALKDKDLSKGVKLYVTNREGSRFVFIRSEK